MYRALQELIVMDMTHAQELIDRNPFLGKKELIYTFLRDEIENRVLPSGVKIKQEELSAQFKVSRSPVREALQQLCDEGFLQRDGATGYCVYELRLGDYILLNDYRTMQEVFGTEQCVRYIGTGELRELKNNLDRSAKAVEARDIQGFASLDLDFHKTIVQASHNPYLIRAYEQNLHLYHFFGNMTLTSSVLPGAYRYHALLYKAISQGNMDSAVRLAKLHRENTCFTASAQSRDGALDPPPEARNRLSGEKGSPHSG